MSRAYRRFAGLLLVAWSCPSFALFAADDVSEPACDAAVCVVNVIAAKLVVPPCVGYSVLMAYSEASGATLIQCSKSASAERNKTFIYDRDDPKLKPFEFDGGRFIRSDYLAKAQTEGIPDQFGSLPLCPAKNRKSAAPGELLLAKKEPTVSKRDSYCYRIHYVLAGKGSLTIRSDDRQEEFPLSENAMVKWARLRERLAKYIDGGHAGRPH